ncbi:hypothetical protein BHM03_00039594 [Ensete ventricosum]|nr:hypothetical protein BHM03_00039594 [Ensete ventricosum]
MVGRRHNDEMSLANKVFNLISKVMTLLGVVSVLPMKATISSPVSPLGAHLDRIGRPEESLLLNLEKNLCPSRIEGDQWWPCESVEFEDRVSGSWGVWVDPWGWQADLPTAVVGVPDLTLGGWDDASGSVRGRIRSSRMLVGFGYHY